MVGKGKFAKRVPKHLRDLLSAESGCNDGMAFPFIYLALYTIKYKPHAGEIIQHWVCLTILYECLFGAIYGVIIGYAGRHAIRYAERKNLIDRESFLVFYFVLALFLAGTGSMLGLDDLLVGFCAGVAFSNDGWFSQQTEDSHVSNVIDLLLNLAFFVYFGSIIPWSSYNRPDWGITPWRLVVISVMVILFRRIPIMLALKPVIPDIKTWREALFAGHFGPIGVGAIFIAILARAKLETGEATPLAVMPPPGSVNYLIIELIWPITTFLIMASILVHGSSVAVFTLGKRINTMRITMSFTTANEEANWMNRLPRLTPKASMRKSMDDGSNSDIEKMYHSPGGIPGGFLARKVEGDSAAITDESRIRRHGAGGPISDSAIHPQRTRTDPLPLGTVGDMEDSPSSGETVVANSGTGSGSRSPASQVDPNSERQPNPSVFREGEDVIIEDHDGNVTGHTKAKGTHTRHLPSALDRVAHPHERHQPGDPHEVPDEQAALAAAQREAEAGGHRRRPAWAYRIDDNVIVEDDDGEVIRRYKLPREKRPGSGNRTSSIPWATGWTQKFMPRRNSTAKPVPENDNDDDDDAKTVYSMKRDTAGESSGSRNPIHWRMHDERGRRLSKQEFLQQLQRMDPHARAAMASPPVSAGPSHVDLSARLQQQTGAPNNKALPQVPRSRAGDNAHGPKDERDAETTAERRRREAALGLTGAEENDSDDEGQAGRLDAKSGKKNNLQLEPLQQSVSPGIRFAPNLQSPTAAAAAAAAASGSGAQDAGQQDAKDKGKSA